MLIKYSKGWNSCIFSFVPEFMAMTLKPSVSDSIVEEFTIPSLSDSVDGDCEEIVALYNQSSEEASH